MKTRLILQKEEKTILSIKFKNPTKSKRGELDIMIDAGNQMYFDQTVAGNFFRYYRYPEVRINSISWHGYYETIRDGLLYTPIIHFKNGRDRIAEEWHLGSINHEEPFAFPICSLYVPGTLDLSSMNKNQYEQSNKINYHFKSMDDKFDKRVDIFVTPKGLSAQEVLQSSIGWLYRMADIDMFNDKEGTMSMLSNKNLSSCCELEVISDESGHDIIIRTVGQQSKKSLFSSLEGSFSLLLHDPNEVYQKVMNRLVIEVGEGSNVLSNQGLLNTVELLKIKYEDEIGHNVNRAADKQ